MLPMLSAVGYVYPPPGQAQPPPEMRTRQSVVYFFCFLCRGHTFGILRTPSSPLKAKELLLLDDRDEGICVVCIGGWFSFPGVTMSERHTSFVP